MSEMLKTEVKKEMVDIESLFKDGKILDGLDLDKVELVQGKTPAGIADKCLNLCKDYLSGNWTQQTLDTIEVRRITGGLLNQIYFCGIREAHNCQEVPQEVVIKFYGDFRPRHDDDKSRITDLVISLIFSEKGLGPKIYGLFDGGQIQKFYKHRAFDGNDKKKSAITEEVYRILARIHSLNVPLKKNGKQVVNMLDKCYEDGIETLTKTIAENNLETFKKHDLKIEIDWIKSVITKVKSPEVFCHSDFRSSNIMITEPNDHLVICDYDLSGYNYRGSEFSMMMREWKNRHFFLNMKNIEGLPLESELRPFIQIYVDECERIHGKTFSQNENNSVDHILKEAKIFLLLSYLYFTAAFIKGPPQPEDGEKGQMGRPPPMDPKVMMEMMETNYKNYIIIKEILTKQNLFDD